MRLAVSGAQPLFTLGLIIFALSLVDFLSLLLSPSTYFKIFYFCQKYHLKDTYKIFKKFHVGLKFLMRFVGPILSCERLAFEVFLSCLFDGPLGIAYANMLATTQWPLERAVHLTSLVWVCVLWLPESLMALSALWGFILDLYAMMKTSLYLYCLYYTRHSLVFPTLIPTWISNYIH